jgi:malonate decarboxylase beta subunit
MSAPNPTRSLEGLLARRSFIELSARERGRAILDSGSFRELLGPFERMKSPWLPLQGIVQQADDGVVVARGLLAGAPAVVAAVEGAYLGGSLGEVSGSKIAGALELALRDCERSRPVVPVLLLETGGVRLQEANLGLAVIAEIHAAIVALRRHVPVIGVIAGMVGCFGGMSLAAALCTHLIVTRQARLAMNGPEVIEQEAGIAELDASDRALIWSLIGGEQRYLTDLADALVDDDVDAIAASVREAAQRPAAAPRSAAVERFPALLSSIDPLHAPSPQDLRLTWARAATGPGLHPSTARAERTGDIDE